MPVPMLRRLSIPILLLHVLVLNATAQDTRRVVTLAGERAEFALVLDQIVVAFDEATPAERKSAIFDEVELLEAYTETVELPAPRVTIPRLRREAAPEELTALLARLEQYPEVRYANPFVQWRDGTRQGILDRMLVRLRSRADLIFLQELASRTGCRVLGPMETDPMIMQVSAEKTARGDAFELATVFHETGRFVYAEPDFLKLIRRFATTNDPQLAMQWALNNTGGPAQYNGTPGADLDVFAAWNTTTGRSTIKIAIIDEGVDLNHPDLVANLLPGYDATGLGSNGGPSGNDAHGTACAGIVAAAGNNAVGIAGIAYSCKIIPIRIAYSVGPYWSTTDAMIANGMNWAWQAAMADILSNSWGGGSVSSAINGAIDGAIANGRSGKGSLVLFAAGNSNSGLIYPSSYASTIAVAAMSMCDQRKSPSSCDGETWWGSCFGTGLDIAAPGVKIYTTDISGTAGYSSGDYAPTFNGTSSACPNAAGVAALILSVDTMLSVAQARRLLERSCEKVGGYVYTANVPNQPSGTWSTELGYGRVNAAIAVQLAAAVSNDIIAHSPLESCLFAGNTVQMPFVAIGTFHAGNTFTAQLSDASGSFAAPVTLGSVSGISDSVITGVLPGSTTPGTGFRVRIVSSNPADTSNPNAQNLTIRGQILTYAVSGGGGYCSGGGGMPVTLSGSQAGVEYQLLRNGTAVGSVVPGSGSPLAFGNQTTAGTYTVTGRFPSDPCAVPMTGSAVVTIEPVPAVTVSSAADTICTGSSTQLSAVGVLNTYTVSPLAGPALAVPPSAVRLDRNTPVSSGSLDDGFWANIPIGFSFPFFTNTYSTCFIGTNGYLTFGSGNSSFTPQLLPSATTPNNLIAACWADLILTNSGSISYWTEGAVPMRRFIVQWTAAPFFTGGGTADAQLVLHESGAVDIHLISIVSSQNRTVGIEDATGTIAFTPPNRNRGAWSLTSPESWRLAPIPLTYRWSPAAGLSDTTSAMPLATPSTTTTYTVTVSTPAGCATSVPITITVKPRPTASIVPASPVTQCPGTTVPLSANTGTGLSWQWNVNGNPIQGATSSTYLAAQTGMYSVTVTFDGCSTTSSSVAITFADTQKPTFTSPAPPVSAALPPNQCTMIVLLPVPTATDLCGVPVVTAEMSDGQLLGAPYQPGVTTVRWIATDMSGNRDTLLQTVTVIDVNPPVITAPAALSVKAVAGQCSRPLSALSLGVPLVSDNCMSGVVVSNNAPPVFPVGNTTVIWTARDASGNTASASQVVTVVDRQAPVMQQLGPITVTAPAGSCSINRSSIPMITPTASDNCPGTITVSHNLGTTIPVGNTIIIWTARDVAGNTSIMQQKLTVRDVQAPTITAPSSRTFASDPGTCSKALAGVTLGTPTVSDNCPSGLTTSHDAPAVFPLGVTLVTWTARDASGNTASAVQQITITDSERPSISAPADLRVQVSSDRCDVAATTLTLGTPRTGDNCGVASVTNTAPASFPVGTTVVVWTVTDAAGNSATATQRVVVEDATPPGIFVRTQPSTLTPADQTMRPVQALVTVLDNCPGTTYRLTSVTSSEPDQGAGPGDLPGDISAAIGSQSTSFALRAERFSASRTYTITYSASDPSGNTSTISAIVVVPVSAMTPKLVVTDDGDVPSAPWLEQNYPNPFNPSTSIRFGVPRDGRVVLALYTIRGERVTTLIDTELQAGTHAVPVDASSMPSGVYLYVLEYESFRMQRQMTVQK